MNTGFQMRIVCLLVTLVSIPSLTPVVAQENAVVFEANVLIPMRDGTKMAASVFRPKSGGTFPTILSRTPTPSHDSPVKHGQNTILNKKAILSGKGERNLGIRSVLR